MALGSAAVIIGPVPNLGPKIRARDIQVGFALNPRNEGIKEERGRERREGN